MTTTYEVVVNATSQGKRHTNVFHVADTSDAILLTIIADVFDASYVDPMLPFISTTMRFFEIVVTSLTGANPGTFTKSISKPGLNPDDPLVTGVHLFTKLISGDASFKAGGKLNGGFVETQFTGGNPIVGLLDGIQALYDTLLVAVNTIAFLNLVIYRPSLSLPGLPIFSLVAAMLTRGDSTNNRRRLSFER